MPAEPENTPEPCVNCGTALAGPYCSACGERRPHGEEHSLRRLVVESFRDALNMDAKVWASFRTLLLQPGRLTTMYLAGRRVGLLGPVQLFLVANLAYFLVQPLTGFNGYNTPLGSHMTRQLYSRPARVAERVEREIQARTMDRATRDLAPAAASGPAPSAADSAAVLERARAVEGAVYPARFDTKGEVYALSLVALIIPFLALALWVLYLGAGKALVTHAVTAIHLHAWQLLFISSLFLLVLGNSVRALLFLLQRGFGVTPAELVSHPVAGVVYLAVMEYSSLLLVAIYTYLALRHVYGGGRTATALRTAAMVVVGFYATAAYRFILFWLTWTTT